MEIIRDAGHIEAIRNAAPIGSQGITLRMDGHSRMDAITVFGQRDLEFVESQVMEHAYAPLDGSLLTPYDMSVADYFLDITGKTAIAGGRPTLVGTSTTQIPNVDLGHSEKTWPFRQYAIGAAWSQRELRAAAAMGQSLDTDGAVAANQALFTQINDVVFFGDASAGLKGFFGDSDVPRTEATGGLNSSSTSQECVDILNELVNSPNEQSENVERVNRLALSSRAYQYLSGNPMSADNPISILNQFLMNNTFVTTLAQVMRIVKFNDITSEGEVLQECAAAYNYDPTKLRTNVVNPHTEGGIVQVGLQYIQLYTANVSSVQFRRPKAARLLFNTNQI